jgi:cystinosin
VFACLLTAGQCVFFKRGGQRISCMALLIGTALIIFLAISTIVCIADQLSTLTLLYFFSYVKLAITMIKYVPQAWMNYRRKSTDGWSIGNILLDFTGGLLSVLQMFLMAGNYDDWASIFGSPTKFGLGMFSIIFDIFFITQHYLLYPPARTASLTSDSTSNEQAPLLTGSNSNNVN